MAFSLTSKNPSLRGPWLSAMVQKADSSWTYSRLDLNKHIGNADGAFDVTIDRWHDSADASSCRLRGTFLFARLRATDGDFAAETCINLDLFVANVDGCLRFQTLSESILVSAACLTLNNNLLSGLVLGRDGKFHPSALDLDHHYGNIGGRFEAGRENFSLTGRNLRLELDANAAKLVGEIKDYDGEYRASEIDLSVCVVNRQGQLVFEENDGWFKKDHWITSISDQIPVLGEALAGLIRFGDNEPETHQTLHNLTNSAATTASLALGSRIGRALSSPTLGLLLGAGLGSPAHLCLWDRIAALDDPDPGVRGAIREATVGRYVAETLGRLFGDGAAAAAAELLYATLDPAIDCWLDRGSGDESLSGEWEVVPAVLEGFSLYAMLKKIPVLLQGESIDEWNDALQVLDDKLKQHQPEPYPLDGHDYAIKVHGTRLALTSIDGTQLRLRIYSGSATQHFRCEVRHQHMGFICVGADGDGGGGRGRYLSYDSDRTLVCGAPRRRRRGWEHVGVVPDEGQGGCMMWMARDDCLWPVSRVSGDKLKIMPSSFTYFSFHRLD
ncbi:hypothetical protein GGR54DRAFT_649186 [Hypoxylon sp. NC1633]|nr:hypothetical protein GGR54DRAFT_649186 [Hypoxylon sp. NC1633]